MTTAAKSSEILKFIPCQLTTFDVIDMAFVQCDHDMAADALLLVA